MNNGKHQSTNALTTPQHTRHQKVGFLGHTSPVAADRTLSTSENNMTTGVGFSSTPASRTGGAQGSSTKELSKLQSELRKEVCNFQVNSSYLLNLIFFSAL